MFNICTKYGVIWDISFNPAKSHLATVGDSNPEANLQLSNKSLDWSCKVKYLGLYLMSGANFRIDLSVAKQKYYGCFNNINSVTRQQINELMVLKLVKTYCLQRLLYGCEIWPLETTHIHELDVIWNDGFRRIFDCCWRDSVKPLQFFCKSLPVSYLTDERQLIFFNKL